MNIKTKTMIIFAITTTLLFLPTVSSQETTNLEILGFTGGLGGVTVDVKNTGDNTADNVWITTSITGGLLNGVDLVHECSGSCSSCVPLEPGSIKSENTLEAGVLFGFGAIQISTSAGAANAEEVSDAASGFLLGPFVIIN